MRIRHHLQHCEAAGEPLIAVPSSCSHQIRRTTRSTDLTPHQQPLLGLNPSPPHTSPLTCMPSPTPFPPQPIIVSALVAVVEMAAMLGLEELCETGVGALFKVREVWGKCEIGGAVRDRGGRAVQGGGKCVGAVVWQCSGSAFVLMGRVPLRKLEEAKDQPSPSIPLPCAAQAAGLSSPAAYGSPEEAKPAVSPPYLPLPPSPPTQPLHTTGCGPLQPCCIRQPRGGQTAVSAAGSIGPCLGTYGRAAGKRVDAATAGVKWGQSVNIV